MIIANIITDTLSGPLATPIAEITPTLANKTDNDLLPSLLVIAITGSTIAIGTFLYNLFTNKNNYTLEGEIEAALMPYLQSLIMAAFEEMSEELEELEDDIETLDKAALVEKLYAMLPDTVGKYDTRFVKSVLTLEQTTELFMMAYDAVKLQYVEHKGEFAELFEDWKK